jgi:hypothetical protein
MISTSVSNEQLTVSSREFEVQAERLLETASFFEIPEARKLKIIDHSRDDEKAALLKKLMEKINNEDDRGKIIQYLSNLAGLPEDGSQRQAGIEGGGFTDMDEGKDYERISWNRDTRSGAIVDVCDDVDNEFKEY